MRRCRNVQKGRSAIRMVIGRIPVAVAVLMLLAGTAGAASVPKTVAEIALYHGPDRERILIRGPIFACLCILESTVFY